MIARIKPILEDRNRFRTAVAEFGAWLDTIKIDNELVRGAISTELKDDLIEVTRDPVETFVLIQFEKNLWARDQKLTNDELWDRYRGWCENTNVFPGYRTQTHLRNGLVRLRARRWVETARARPGLDPDDLLGEPATVESSSRSSTSSAAIRRRRRACWRGCALVVPQKGGCIDDPAHSERLVSLLTKRRRVPTRRLQFLLAGPRTINPPSFHRRSRLGIGMFQILRCQRPTTETGPRTWKAKSDRLLNGYRRDGRSREGLGQDRRSGRSYSAEGVVAAPRDLSRHWNGWVSAPMMASRLSTARMTAADAESGGENSAADRVRADQNQIRTGRMARI